MGFVLFPAIFWRTTHHAVPLAMQKVEGREDRLTPAPRRVDDAGSGLVSGGHVAYVQAVRARGFASNDFGADRLGSGPPNPGVCV